MQKQVFRKEERVLGRARRAVRDAGESDLPLDPAFTSLVDEYERLFRQSRRLVTMGDRMQSALNDANTSLAASERKFRSIFESVTEGIYRCNRDGTFVEVNPAMAEMLGFSSPEAFLEATPDFGALFCEEKEYLLYGDLLDASNVCRYQVRVSGGPDNELWAEISANVMHDGTGVVGVMADVTERKHMIEEMCRLARTDALTGLWNRGYLMELAERELVRAKRMKGALALLIIDADYFKAINDTHGHDVGDKALVCLSRVIRESVREIDVVGRFGGEEFVVVLPEADRRDGCRAAERILSNVRKAVVDGGDGTVSMTVSIGLTSYENDRDDLDSLIKFADIALYGAKKNGRDRVEVYRRTSCLCAEDQTCAVGHVCAGKEESRP